MPVRVIGCGGTYQSLVTNRVVLLTCGFIWTCCPSTNNDR